MAIKVKCPACGKKMFPPESAAGKNIRCPDCRFVIKVPGEAGPLSGILRPATTALGVPPGRPTRNWLWIALVVLGLVGVVVVTVVLSHQR